VCTASTKFKGWVRSLVEWKESGEIPWRGACGCGRQREVIVKYFCTFNCKIVPDVKILKRGRVRARRLFKCLVYWLSNLTVKEEGWNMIEWFLWMKKAKFEFLTVLETSGEMFWVEEWWLSRISYFSRWMKVKQNSRRQVINDNDNDISEREWWCPLPTVNTRQVLSRGDLFRFGLIFI